MLKHPLKDLEGGCLYGYAIRWNFDKLFVWRYT